MQNSHVEVSRLSLRSVIVAAVLFVGAVLFSLQLASRNSESSVQGNPVHSIFAAQGSLTDCIEKGEIANEIEISDSAMMRATQRVLSFFPEHSSESSEYCALSLV